MRQSSVFRQSLLYFVGNLVRRGLGFFLIPLYTRFLTPADYGVVELVELCITVVSITFGVLAASDAMVRIYHEEVAGEKRNQVVSTTMLAVGGVSLLLGLGGMLWAQPLSPLVFNSRGQGELLQAAFAAMVLSNLNEIALVYQRMRQRPVLVVIFSLAHVAVNAGLNIYFIGFAHQGAWGFVLSKLICAALGSAFLLPLTFGEVGVRFTRAHARRLAHFGWPLVFTSLCFFLIHFGDRFFLSRMRGTGEVGVYSLAYRFAFLITFMVGEPFGSVWNVTLYAHTEDPGWKERFARVAHYLFLCLFLAGVAVSILIDQVIPLIADRSYGAAAALVPTLAFGYVLREIGDFFRGLLFISKRVVLFSKIVMVCALLNLLLNTILIGPFGARGAAWATLLTWLVYMLACWRLAQREHQIPSLVRPLAHLAVVSVAVCLLARLSIQMHPVWQWGMDGALLLLFVGTLWASGYIGSEDRAAVRSYLVGSRTGWLAVAERLR